MSARVTDQETRDRLRTELDRTFFVEAGAGTGKTRVLVERIVETVATGRARMESLAAITFTEAAAAELKDRIRHGLESATGSEERSSEERARCKAASLEIDCGAIQTIHSFAGLLLRTFPLEAGLPPGFAILDEIQQRRDFENRFRTWLYDQVPDTANRDQFEAVRRILSLDLRPLRLHDLAQKLHENYDLLDPEPQWTHAEAPPALDLAQRLGPDLLALNDLTRYAKRGEEDELVQEVMRAQFIGRAMAAATDEDEALALVLQLATNPPKSKGSQKDWDGGEGNNPIKTIKGTFKDAKDCAEALIQAHRCAALVRVLKHLRSFVLDYARERKQHGVAGFHDLLVWARDLLRDNPGARLAATRKYSRIFIDEFQDTDPLQAEMAWFLAGDPASAQERDWRNVGLTEGKLFLVGDPKQSIYRFRRADIAVYQEAFGCADPEGRASLIQNFRSAAEVIGWVNYQLDRDMREKAGIQAAYRALEPRPPLGIEAPEHRFGVWAVGEQVPGKAYIRWRREADAVAEAARVIVRDGWVVSETGAGAPRVRAARYEDICVLLPTRNNLRRLERAFDGQGVPYRVESGSLVLNTQEVRDMLSCLRAIDDPSDQVALVAALRSSAYGCSDVDLLAWIEAGGRLGYEDERTHVAGRVADAFVSLRTLNAKRMERPAAVTMEILIRERMLAVQAMGQPRPREAWRRLRYLVGRARALCATGSGTLRELLDWLEGLQRTTFYDAESPVPEADENAVRFMTVHGAKGLEFPIVILTGIGARELKYRGESQITVDWQTGQKEVRCGKDFYTPGFDEAQVNECQSAEQLRLLYVATTRARDHLVLSLYHGRDQCHAKRILESMPANGAGLIRPFELAVARASGEPDLTETRESETDPLAVEPVPPSPEAHAQAELQWVEERGALIEALRSQPLITPTILANRASGAEDPTPDILDLLLAYAEDEDLSLGDEAEDQRARTGKGATALGRAVHQILQRIDLRTLNSIDQMCQAAATSHGVHHRLREVTELVRAAANSQAVRNALAGLRYWREISVGATLGGSLLEGRMDLLYEHHDGTLGIVDYKTDHLDQAMAKAREPKYRAQGGAYALALGQSSGRRVSSVEFVFASLGGRVLAYDANDIGPLINEARSLIW